MRVRTRAAVVIVVCRTRLMDSFYEICFRREIIFVRRKKKYKEQLLINVKYCDKFCMYSYFLSETKFYNFSAGTMR